MNCTWTVLASEPSLYQYGTRCGIEFSFLSCSYTGIFSLVTNVIIGGVPPVASSEHEAVFNLYWRFRVKCTVCNVQRCVGYNKSILNTQGVQNWLFYPITHSLMLLSQACPARCIIFNEFKNELIWFDCHSVIQRQMQLCWLNWYHFPPVQRNDPRITYPAILAWEDPRKNSGNLWCFLRGYFIFFLVMPLEHKSKNVLKETMSLAKQLDHWATCGWM